MSGLSFTWGGLVAQLRREQKLSQRQLSEKTSVGRTILRRLEMGSTQMSVENFERLLDYLGYELEAMQKDVQVRDKPPVLKPPAPHHAQCATASDRSSSAAKSILDMRPF